MSLLRVIAVTLALAPSAAAAAQRADAVLAARVAERVASVPGAEVAVSYRDLASRDSLDVNAAVEFHAASTMKIPV